MGRSLRGCQLGSQYFHAGGLLHEPMLGLRPRLFGGDNATGELLDVGFALLCIVLRLAPTLPFLVRPGIDFRPSTNQLVHLSLESGGVFERPVTLPPQFLLGLRLLGDLREQHPVSIFGAFATRPLGGDLGFQLVDPLPHPAWR